MEQEHGLSETTTVQEPERAHTNSGDTEKSDHGEEQQCREVLRENFKEHSSYNCGTLTKRKLLSIGILTVGVLCIVQAALNVSLRLASYSKENTDQLPFNSSVIADVCQIDQSAQNSAQFCSCCRILLRRLCNENQALEKERDLLRKELFQVTQNKTREEDSYLETGSGFF